MSLKCHWSSRRDRERAGRLGFRISWNLKNGKLWKICLEMSCLWRGTDGVVQRQNILFSERQRVLLYNNSSLNRSEGAFLRQGIHPPLVFRFKPRGSHAYVAHDVLVCGRQQGLRKASRVCVMLCIANPGPFPRETTGQGRNAAEIGQHVFISETWRKSKADMLNTVLPYISIWLLLENCVCFLLNQSKLCLYVVKCR